MTASPILRLAIGWVGLSAFLIIVADMLIGVLPDLPAHTRSHHRDIAHLITTRIAEGITQADYASIPSLLDITRKQQPTIYAIRVRSISGAAIASSGVPASAKDREFDRAVVSIMSSDGKWGEAEFLFKPYYPTTLSAWLDRREFWLALGLPLSLLVVAYFYLRRTLLYLDPTSVVPEYVRAGFDRLTEGVALLDTKQRVVLINRSLRELSGAGEARLVGKRLADAADIALPPDLDAPPWETVFKTGRPVLGVRVRVGTTRAPRSGSMNCSPVLDGTGRVRGSLVTIADLSEIEKANDELRKTLGELEQSREQIEKQNRELLHLAMHDGLTGLLNRRAYFDSATSVISRNRQSGRPVAVLMLDVDHFKSFNDRYGHALGDAVLRRVAECLRKAVRTGDWTGRYGGEEFSALLDGASVEEALAIAERLRSLLEETAGRGIHEGKDLTVTASIGVATSPPHETEFETLVNLADEALYAAKHGGRNRVVLAEAPAPQEVPVLQQRRSR